MYLMKKHVFPEMYWSGLLKGTWKGPKENFGWLQSLKPKNNKQD